MLFPQLIHDPSLPLPLAQAGQINSCSLPKTELQGHRLITLADLLGSFRAEQPIPAKSVFSKYLQSVCEPLLLLPRSEEPYKDHAGIFI